MNNRRTVLLLLVVLAVVTFLDRISISVAGPRMQAALGISPSRWGWVLGAFVLAYGLFEIPTGALGDRFGQRNVLTRIVLWWSGFTALTGAATGFSGLLVTRFLFGAGEAGAYPNMAGVIARWFPATERARAQGFIWGASRLGGALSPLLVVPLQRAVGWRLAFVILGAAGVIWIVCWRVLYRDGAEPEARVPARPRIGLDWAALFRERQLWLIVAMYWCYAWGSWFFFGWFPVYLVKGAGFSESEMAIFSALPFVLGTIGNLAGGYLSDYISARLGLRLGRRLVGALSLAAAAALLIAMTLTRNKAALVAFSSLGFGVSDVMLPSAWALCVDIGGSHSGAVTGVMNTAGQFGGFACSVLFGYVVQATGNYNAPLCVISGMLLVSAALFTRIDPEHRLICEPELQQAAR